jgi:peptidoglycan/xylan/chitin deacetylase (PgdA/CDA1 family)
MRAVPDDGSATESSPAPFRGSRSLRVEGRGDAPLVAEFDRPVDFRDAHLSAAIYPDKPDNTGPFTATLYAPDPENRIVCRGNYHGYFDCGWRRYDFSINDVVGDPDPSRVRAVELDIADENELTRYWVDDIRVLPRPDRGKVMFMFDDIAESAFTNGFRILNEFGLRGSYGVISDIVGEKKRLSVDQLRRAERAGWDLVSHSKTGERLTDLSSADQRRYLGTAKEWLQDHALDPAGAEHFVFPLAKYGRTSLANVGDFHEMAYIGGRGSAPALTDRLTIARRPGRRRLPKLRRWLRAAARHRNLLVLVFHTINRDFTDTFRHLAAKVSRMVERNQIDVITPTELSALQSRLAAE